MAKERPILFSTLMVQAILEGRKTMTRRALRIQPDDSGLHDHTKYPMSLQSDLKGWHGTTEDTGESREWKCPYGDVGDILWVRETWRKYYHVDEYGYTKFDDERIEYAADNPPMIPEMDGDGFHLYNKDGSEKFIPWRPSIFMPKAACRIRLEITGIRVEKLNVISFEDARYEGVERSSDASGKTWYKNYAEEIPHNYKNPIQSFMSLWEKINGKFTWDKEPWVWVIEFKKL